MRLGYLTSWQPSYSSSDNSAIEVISDTNETALDSTTPELTPATAATASNNENKNLNSQRVAENKGDTKKGTQVKKDHQIHLKVIHRSLIRRKLWQTLLQMRKYL